MDTNEENEFQPRGSYEEEKPCEQHEWYEANQIGLSYYCRGFHYAQLESFRGCLFAALKGYLWNWIIQVIEE